MSKILKINDGIKINEDNVDFGSLAMISVVSKATFEDGTEIKTLTLNASGYNGFALLSVVTANDNGNLYYVLVRNGTIHAVDKIVNMESDTVISYTNTQLSIKMGSWANATLIDFGNNSWS